MVHHSFNADFCGDTPHGSSYPVMSLPVAKQRQELVSKKLLKKRTRQIFNNKSLKRKIGIRKLSKTLADNILAVK